jgi:hypothetical protein
MISSRARLSSKKAQKSFYQRYLQDDSESNNSSDEDSLQQLINEEVDAIRKRRASKRRKRRSIFRQPNGLWCDDTEAFVRPDPKTCTWYKLYVASDSFGRIPRLMRKFCKWFRMSRQQFMELVELGQSENWFPSAEKKDCTGRIGHPLELMLLGSLCYLGRGFTFDDLEESTFVSESSHRKFFHEFH